MIYKCSGCGQMVDSQEELEGAFDEEECNQCYMEKDECEE